MAVANLTAERLREALHYSPETGVFTWRIRLNRNTVIGSLAGHTNKKEGYIQIGIDGRTYRAHRLAWLYVHGVWPQEQIDHKNADRSNTCISNLREANHQLNQQNLRKACKDNKSGFLGVSRHGPHWRACIKADRKSIHLGVFGSPQEAHEAYLIAKRLWHRGGTI